MTPTTDHTSGVNSILRRARIYNPEIGNYMQHFTNERFNYTVRLSNGRIEIPSSMALDEERMPSSITEDRIQNVANSFQNNNPKPQTNVLENVSLNEVEEDVKTVIPKLSLWQKLLRLLGLK